MRKTLLKKLKSIAFLFMLLISGFAFSQVGIGTASPNNSAILELASKDKGFLPPRLTTAERDAITTRPIGLSIYNTVANCLEYWNGREWISTCSSTIALGTVASLDCANHTTIGTLKAQTNAAGVVSAIPYTGGDGGSYASQMIPSEGVTGLMAILPAGNFNNGDGLLTFNIVGTPIAAGDATFIINVGGQVCTLKLTINPIDEKCTAVGVFRSPNTINKYYRCIAHPTISGEFLAYEHTCPTNAIYDESISLCRRIR